MRIIRGRRIRAPRRRNRHLRRDEMGMLVNLATALRTPRQNAIIRMSRSSRLVGGLRGLLGRARARLSLARQLGVPSSHVFHHGRRMR